MEWSSGGAVIEWARHTICVGITFVCSSFHGTAADPEPPPVLQFLSHNCRAVSQLRYLALQKKRRGEERRGAERRGWYVDGRNRA